MERPHYETSIPLRPSESRFNRPTLQEPHAPQPTTSQSNKSTTSYILNHLNAYKRTPTTFLSFGTWRCLSSRIARWEALGVRNMKLHLIATSILPITTKVFKSADWAAQYSPQGAKPYLDGEYLVQGPVPASSFFRSGLPVQDIPLCPGLFLRSGIPVQHIPLCPGALVMGCMQ